MAGAGGLAGDLTIEVDIHGVIDGHEVINGGDGANVVDVADGRGHAHTVLVDEVIEALRACGEGEGLTTVVDVLILAADLAGQRNIHEGIHVHLRMDGEILQIRLTDHHTHGVGHTADAQLEASTVGDLPHHQLCHFLVDLGGLSRGQDAHRIIAAFHDHIHVGDMDCLAKAAVNTGHLLVDLHDDRLGGIANSLQVRGGNAEVEVAVLIHGGNLEHGNIGLIEVLVAVTGQLRVAHGGVEAGTGVDVLALCAAGVVGVKDDVLMGLFDVEDGGTPQADTAAHLHLLQLGCALCQCLVQYAGMGASEAIVHPIAGLDHLYCLLSSGEFFTIHTHEFFKCHCLFLLVIFL